MAESRKSSMGQYLNIVCNRTMLLNVLHMYLIMFTFCMHYSCSSHKAEEQTIVKSEENTEKILGHNHKVKTQSTQSLSNCKNDQEEGWKVQSKSLELCSFPTVIYQCISTFDREGMGAQVKWAILKKTKSLSSLNAKHVLWEGVIASEEIPNAHAERIYSRTRLVPSKDILKDNECRAFTAIREQRARSFNQVDARETEFDESSTDEVTFEYDVHLMRYIEAAKEAEPEIKVRSR